MKRIIVLSTIILAAAMVFVGSSDGKSKSGKKDPILSVSDIQGDSAAYKGTITVTGVVAGVSKKEPKLFAMIETLEAKLCKQTGCAEFYLPVRYEGKIPKIWDEVNVTGSLANKDGRLFLKAAKVKVLKHLKF